MSAGTGATFIGDVHGWADRLERILAQAIGPLVFLGDLIDRGPSVREVVARVRGLCDAGRARCLLGNHEWALARALAAGAAPPMPGLFEAWVDSWGGAAVLRSYRATSAADLRRRMGADLEWLASLPWMIEGGDAARGWLAVHAGLDDRRPFRDQRSELLAGWAAAGDRPHALFSKQHEVVLPYDLPAGLCVVSGHTPRACALVSPLRILCDTSGGRRDRPLSAVTWPTGTVLTG